MENHPHTPNGRPGSRTGFHIATAAFTLIAILLVGVLLVGFLLPGSWEARAETRLAAHAGEVFPYLASYEGWSQWTPVPEAGVEPIDPDREAGVDPIDPGQGVGEGGWSWDDTQYGSGRFLFLTRDPPREVRYRVEVEGGSLRTEGRILLEATGEGTTVKWSEEGDFGWNPLLGYLAARMGRAQAEQMSRSLERLRSVVDGEEHSPRASTEPPDSS